MKELLDPHITRRRTPACQTVIRAWKAVLATPNNTATITAPSILSRHWLPAVYWPWTSRNNRLSSSPTDIEDAPGDRAGFDPAQPGWWKHKAGRYRAAMPVVTSRPGPTHLFGSRVGNHRRSQAHRCIGVA